MTEHDPRSDVPAALAKGILGAIPVVGPIVAEVLGTLLPSRRLERLEKLLARLGEQVRGLDEDRLRSRFRSPEFVDLFEDGVFQAARAINDERIQYVASILTSGVTSEREEFLEEKTLLGLLGELNDVEIILLRSYARQAQEDEDFRSKHAVTLEPTRASMDSPRSELDEHTIREAYLAHLARLGLLRPDFRRPRRGELPEFDNRTGMIKASGYELTPLGYLLLARVELISDEERP